jgi:hypothetical protein
MSEERIDSIPSTMTTRRVTMKAPHITLSRGPFSCMAQQYSSDPAPWRAQYKTARWQRLRVAVLLRDLFTCKMCGRLEGILACLCVTTSHHIEATCVCSGMNQIFRPYARHATTR